MEDVVSYHVGLLLEGLLFVGGLQFLPTSMPHSLHPLFHRLHVGDELADRRYGAQELRVELYAAASVWAETRESHLTVM